MGMTYFLQANDISKYWTLRLEPLCVLKVDPVYRVLFRRRRRGCGYFRSYYSKDKTKL